MPRTHRFVLPGFAHHVIQRGNRRQQVFYTVEDRLHYLELLKEYAQKTNTQLLGYCLMPNHVHLVLVPGTRESLMVTVAETHRRYTLRINDRMNWRGYLWQGRYKSFVMGDVYLLRCLRYIERNPVRAKMVQRAEDFVWSSARAHVTGELGRYLSECPQMRIMEDWSAFLASIDPDKDLDQFRRSNSTGHPCGGEDLLVQVSSLYNISQEELKPKPIGRPKLSKDVKK